MHKNLFLSSFLFVFIACMLFIASSVHSADIKERMAARIPAIDALKDQGTIGENNKGFLEYRTGNKPQQQLVAEENKDRALVYEAISKQQGAPTALVGERRAKMISDNGKAGQWFQKSDGTWFRK
jgi:uncharacterized protein YdbL (DUF1318 family)